MIALFLAVEVRDDEKAARCQVHGRGITYVGRTETEKKPFQYRVTLQHVERTQQNPYGLVVSLVEQTEIPAVSFPNPQSKN
jgi:hypothetical protein